MSNIYELEKNIEINWELLGSKTELVKKSKKNKILLKKCDIIITKF